MFDLYCLQHNSNNILEKLIDFYNHVKGCVKSLAAFFNEQISLSICQITSFLVPSI